MSNEAQAVALHHSQATGTDKVVMIAIANYAGEDGAWCSIPTLAKIANVTEESARRAVRRLEQLGEIDTERNGGYGQQLKKPKHTRTNLYTITLVCPEWCDRSMQHRDTREFSSGPSSTSAPRQRRADASVTPGPSSTSGEPVYELQDLGNSLDRSEKSRASDRVSESENPHEHAPRKFGSIAAAQKIANAAKSRERYHAPARPEPVNDARRSANEQALTLPCPAGVGNGRHLVLVGTGTECARCGQDTFTIIDQHNQLEVTP